MMKFLCLLSLCFFTACAMFPASETEVVKQEVGEFGIPNVTPLGPDALVRLRGLARSDAEAKALARKIAEEARPFIGAEPHPLEVIHYEGLVNTDPRRIATVAKLREMGDAARLLRYWQVTGDEAAAATLRDLIVAWTSTYKITGNDVNENKFYPLLVAYEALRSAMPASEVEQVDAWVERLGMAHEKAVKESTHFTNRYSKSVRLLAIAGMVLDRPEWIEEAHKGIQRFVTASLYADGTSADLKRRDTLTYHGSALKPVIELAILAGDSGPSLYNWTNAEGGSIRKSVDYVVPYAMGEKQRREWENSQIEIDRRRARAGLDKYQPGSLYDPKNALELMELASYFDPALLKVIQHLTGSEARRFPTWQTLVNESARPAQPEPSAAANTP